MLTEHPAVDWGVTEKRGYRTLVKITCARCGVARMDDASQVRYRIKRGMFTGYCYADRMLQKEQRGRLPRLPHPAVDWSDLAIVNRHTRVGVTCPKCGVKRYSPTGPTSAGIRSGRLSGLCLPCSPNAQVREWTSLGPGRKLDPSKGYIRLGLEAFTPEDRWVWDSMRGATTFVFEHRAVMAKELGRPLTSRELVDHMDGVKTNNDPANLRLYRRGKNEPGETSGYGTFYHEWQLAEAEVRRLRGLLERRAA